MIDNVSEEKEEGRKKNATEKEIRVQRYRLRNEPCVWCVRKIHFEIHI